MLVISTLLTVVGCTALMVIIVFQGIFSPAKVDLGHEHYGEKADFAIGPFKLPAWMGFAMPLNALVNAGYSLVGLAWVLRTYLARRRGEVGELQAYFAYTFAWMCILYGPVQFWRIISQTHESAVLDQWVTLPFFAWAILWCKALTVGWNREVTAMLMLSSILSYNLVFFTEFGFEIALVIHSVHTASTGFATNRQYPCKGNNFALFMCGLTYVNFVVFKVMDLHLPHYSEFFTEVSGHFISKLFGDVALGHFAFLFFENLAKKQQVESSKKVK
ncbi:transmembrane protein 187-like [Acanthaster planci]|uniref:Transmembrane protein 187-like n=1 Tax=Acanthaster planci TaxID=133434 RepID=A0A8B7ZTZ8_ACAPL|nr:transmembrane protein 187-like [Acanthaster planci]